MPDIAFIAMAIVLLAVVLLIDDYIQHRRKHK